MGWMTPERAARWYRYSVGIYFIGVWTLIGSFMVPYVADAERRKGKSAQLFSDEEMEQLDKNAVLISRRAPLGFVVSLDYRWNFVLPTAQQYKPVKPSSATTGGSDPANPGS